MTIDIDKLPADLTIRQLVAVIEAQGNKITILVTEDL